MSEKSLVWKVVQLEQEVERLTLKAHEAAQRQADAVDEALAIQAEEIVRLHEALECIARVKCSWQLSQGIAREALGGER